MTTEQYFKNLEVPTGSIDVVLDTDAYNEIDDQFAISYMLKSSERFNVKGICAAPFLNSKSVSAKDGMEKSYNEILKLLDLMERNDIKDIVFRGSTNYLVNEATPSESEAADYMAELAKSYSPEKPLYIVAIGAITNVASAMLKNPRMKETCVVIFLGGRGKGVSEGANEFNMVQDIAAARVVFGSGVPLIHFTSRGVTDRLVTTKHELAYWLKGKNKLCDYLYNNTVNHAEALAQAKAWSRVIWDIITIAWFFNDDGKWFSEIIVPCHMPEYDLTYSFDDTRHKIKYIEWAERDRIFSDLFNKLTK